MGGSRACGDSTHTLFEIQAHDPTVFAAVSVVMLGVALVASYMPARRASAMDPAEAIRME